MLQFAILVDNDPLCDYFIPACWVRQFSTYVINIIYTELIREKNDTENTIAHHKFLNGLSQVQWKHGLSSE